MRRKRKIKVRRKRIGLTLNSSTYDKGNEVVRILFIFLKKCIYFLLLKKNEKGKKRHNKGREFKKINHSQILIEHND